METISNLVAVLVVSLSTNVSERVSTHLEYPNPNVIPAVVGYDWTQPHEVSDKDPDFKWIRTEIHKTTSIAWHLVSDDHWTTNQLKDEIIKATEVKLSAQRNPVIWQPMETNNVTPSVNPVGYYFVTNGSYFWK
jgi:hypothetical protein